MFRHHFVELIFNWVLVGHPVLSSPAHSPCLKPVPNSLQQPGRHHLRWVVCNVDSYIIASKKIIFIIFVNWQEKPWVKLRCIVFPLLIDQYLRYMLCIYAGSFHDYISISLAFFTAVCMSTCCFCYVLFIAAWCCYTCLFLFSMFVAIYVMDEEMDDFKGRSPYSSTFRTFDSTDYSSIGTNISRILEFKPCLL